MAMALAVSRYSVRRGIEGRVQSKAGLRWLNTGRALKVVAETQTCSSRPAAAQTQTAAILATDPHRSCFGAQCATCSGPLQQDCELITQQRGLQDAGVSAPVLRGASMLQLSPA
ncbi:hypothetical protein NQZ68_006148 [Dissostichus eleginoides]|nr:hypothetical protein NQZ68_006148 [Dissostichus eleginoides]